MFNKSKKKNLALPVSENNENKTSSPNRKLSIKKNISRSFSSLVSGLRKSINIGKNNQPDGNDGLSTKNKNSNSLSDISSNLHFKKQSSHDKSSGSNTPNQSIKSYKRSLKNSQLSSYYLKNLNDDDANTDNGNKNNQDDFDSNNQNLPLEANKDDAIGTSNHTKKLLSSKLQENEENKNQVKFVGDESDEKLDLIDDLPEFSANNGDTIRKFVKQTSLSSETQASTVSTYLNGANTIPSYYELKIKLNEGTNLAIRDIGGSSDPYAKFVLNGVNVYKSKIIFKNLNPEWNEEFSIKLSPSTLTNKTKRSNSIQSVPQNFDPYLIDEPLESFLSKFKLKMFIYDYDRGFLSDDLIGYSMIDLSFLKENIEEKLEIELEDEKLSKDEYLGLINLTLLLVPKFVSEETEKKEFFSTSKLSSSASTPVLIRNKRAPYQLWQCVVNVILIECSNLLAMDSNGFSDPYVKFRLENERYRSKTIRRTLNPRFLEQFQMYVYDTNKMVMNISVYDYDSTSNSDDFIGKTAIDLKNLDIEKTHFVKSELENEAGSVTLLVTITGIYDTAIFPENIGYNRIFSPEHREEIENKYGLLNSFSNLDDVGWLRVKVLRAQNLASADMNGKSDPFCCLQLNNSYVQTYTVYKTLNPEWGQIFEFEVNDIHSILEVTVLDEDKNKVYEFLGKIEIPLINIKNGKKKIYALKDKKLQKRSKGGIELQMELVYNPIKAVIKTFNPTDERLITQEPKLKVPVLKQNIKRVHNLVQGIINTGNFINSCFCWEYPVRSIIAFLSFVLIVLNFEIYMLPLTLLMIFLKNLMIIKFKTFNTNQDDEELNFECFDEEEDVSDPDSTKEPKKSFRERLNEIQEICLKVQTNLDYVASLGEKIVNTFLFKNSWLSWLAIIILCIATMVMYLVPIRYIILIWGVNKFTKKFRKPPEFVDSMEILDFLSRVPSKKELYKYREEMLQNNAEANNMKSNNKKKRKTS